MLYLNSKKFLLNFVLFLLLTAKVQAFERCEIVGPSSVPSPYGQWTRTICSTPTKKGEPNKLENHRETLNVDGVPVLSSHQLFDIEENKNRSLVLMRVYEIDESTYCDRRIYLIDITKRPVKVFGFGVKNACTEFSSVKWGDRKTVITLKQRVKFIYQNGKMTLPAAGDKLFDDVEPPHGGEGMTQGDPQPFCEEMPLPKSNTQTEK